MLPIGLEKDAFDYRKFAVRFGVALLAAFLVDGWVAQGAGVVSAWVKRSEFAEEIKEPGHFVFVMVLAAFVWILHPSSWRGAVALWGSGIIAGLLYTFAKWPVGRIRPNQGIHPWHFEPFRNGWAGIFHAQNVAFPSGHTTLAFATAACMSHLLPKGQWAFYTVAGLLALERVGEQAHYLSDVIAGAALGILAFRIYLFLTNLPSRPIATPTSTPVTA